MSESHIVTTERDEQSLNPDRRTPLSILRDDYPGDDPDLGPACHAGLREGRHHAPHPGEGCPDDPWGLRWCDFCLGPLMPDEPSEKPCDRCVAEKHDERRKDWDQ